MKAGKVFFVCLMIILGICLTVKAALCQTATARFKISINEKTEPTPKKGDGGGGCLISSLKSSRDNKIRYSMNDVANVVVIISGGGLAAPIEVSLTKDVSGYYTAIQSNLPSGVELSFQIVVKDSAGEIMIQETTTSILEPGVINDIAITLTIVEDTIHVPVVVLTSSDTQIYSNETAKINITVSDDNPEILYEIFHSSGKGTLSKTGGTLILVNNIASAETILTPDSDGGYSDVITVRVDDQHKGIAIVEIEITIQIAQGDADIKINFPPFIDSLTVKDNGDGTMSITAGVSDEADISTIAYNWAGDVAIIGDNTSNPIIIEEPFDSALVSLTVTDELGASNSIDFYVSPNTFEPRIKFTYVPEFGSFDNLRGVVKNVEPNDYRIAVYIKVDGGWWTKPTFALPLTYKTPCKLT